MRIFLDLNVVLDVLAEREPWFEDSASVLAQVESTDTEGFIAAHTVTTLHYLIARHAGARAARRAITDLLRLVAVARVDRTVLEEALALGWPDFEDAVQGACAAQVGADYFITRNVTDFAGLVVPVRTPTQFLSMLGPDEAESGGEAPAGPRRGRPR